MDKKRFGDVLSYLAMILGFIAIVVLIYGIIRAWI